MSLRALCVLLLLLATIPSAHAGKVKLWHQYQQSHYDKAKFKNAVVTSEGVLRLSREIKPLATIAATNVWDLAEDKAGNLYAATGDEGKLLKITPQGKMTVVHTSKDGHLFSLIAAGDAVYAGTGPTGKLLKIAADGTVTTVVENLDSYIWSLAYDASTQSLYAGTGPKGKIYRITPDGKSSVFYTTKQEHILCLAVGDKGTVYAGTDKGGLVYRIDSAGKGFVLYHANQPEVRTLFATPGAVYAGTSAPVARKGGFGSTGGKFDGPASPAPGENSLYRIAPDGAVRELYRDKTMILRIGQAQGKLLLATGMQGQLFEVNEATKEKTEIARLDVGQIHCLLIRRDGSIVLGTGDPGKLFVLSDRFASEGTVVSEVLDAKMQSKWGTLTWNQIGAGVTVAIRSGNVADPDDTWSDWSAEQKSPGPTKAPLGRYVQYRATLKSDDAKSTPEVRQFALRYQTLNQSPEITSIDVPDFDTKDIDSKKLKIKWNATDPNDDELTYNVYCKKDGWTDWVLLEENYDKTNFDWDTASFPTGNYRVKISVSDRKDNPAEDSLSAERISNPVAVTHLPPSVTLKVVGVANGGTIIEATASDPYVRLTEASYAVDGKRWINVFPTDGLFDSKTETFRFTTDALRPGTHVLVLRVRNAAGTFGSADAVLTTPMAKQ